MIELQKYSKVDEEQLLKGLAPKPTDSRFKVVGYVSLAVVATLVLITYQVGNISFSSAAERNLKVFEEEKDAETMKAFVNFISQQGRTYGDRAETANRYRIFKNNYAALARHQAHENHLPYQVNLINQFSDLTEEEFLYQVGRGAAVPQHVLSPVETQFSARKEKVPLYGDETNLPNYKNWVEEGIVGEAQDSLTIGCGSSWAFSSVAALEILNAIKNGGQNGTNLSVQQLIDCDNANNGCAGGWPSKGFAYTSKYGLMSRADYPYTGVQGACQYDETKAVFKNTGMVQERYVSNADLKRLVTKQPVSVGIVVTEAFRSYKGGIITEDSARCSGEKKSINHAVTIVGFGKTEARTLQHSWCSEYWIARNSWGSLWGENGNFKICMDKAGRENSPYGTCHINRFPSYPVAE